MVFKHALKIGWLVSALSGALIAAAPGNPPIVSVSPSTMVVATTQISTYSWRTAPHTPFTIPENLAFVVKWGVITAGYSTLNIDRIDESYGRPAYHIMSEAKTGKFVSAFYKVLDHNESWLDQQSLVSLRFEKHIKEGKFHIEESTLIDQPNGQFHIKSYRVDKKSYEQKEGTVPPNVLDVLSSLYYVRTLPLEVGKTFVMDVLSGSKVYPLEVHVIKREKIKVPAGKFDTFLVEPVLRGPGIFVAKGKKLEVWLTADERRMPVRMRSEVFIGHVSAELTRSLKEAVADAQ